MRWVLVLSVLLAGALGSVPPAAADEAETVRAVMFWDKACPNCEEVLSDVLPAIRARYGQRFQLVLAEMSSVRANDAYFAAVDHFQLPAERQGVPMLVVGDQVLLGRQEIAERLVDEIEQGLSDGGVDLLPALALTAADVAALDQYSRDIWAGEHPSDPLADGLAIAVLVFMLAALVYALVRLWRVRRSLRAVPGGSGRGVSAWVPVLALAGMAVAGYLAYGKLTGSDTICPIGQCDAVQHSSYAALLGVPVSVLGLLTYVAVLALWWFARAGARTPLLLLVGVSLFGTAFSAYLTLLEPFVIHAVCIWCLASAVIITVIMVLAVRAAVAGAPETARRSALASAS